MSRKESLSMPERILTYIPDAAEDIFPEDTDVQETVAHVRRRVFTRRKLLGLFAAAAAVHTADVVVGEKVVWDEREPAVNFIETANTSNRCAAIFPGLGVASGSATRSAYDLRPTLGMHGKICTVRYSDEGFTDASYKKVAAAFGESLQREGVENLTAICHSAGGANFYRTVTAPVRHQERLFGMGTAIGPPSFTESPWEYWRREYGVSFDKVVFISSPPNAYYVKSSPRRIAAQVVGVLPDPLLQAGPGGKLIGNILHNMTIGRDSFDGTKEAVEAAWRSTRDDYSPTTWLTQLDVLDAMNVNEYRGVLPDTVKYALITPSNPDNDTVVETAYLREGWAGMLNIKTDDILPLQHPGIGHADISARPDEFNQLFAQFYDYFEPFRLPVVRGR